MTRLESIVEQAKLLSASERAELIAILKEGEIDSESDEAVGLRGLAALTESTRHEDWSEFYPESIRRLIRERSHDQR